MVRDSRRPPRSGPTTRLLAGGALVGVDSFALLIAALHLLQPDLDPHSYLISDYLDSPSRGLARLAIVLLAGGAVVLAGGLQQRWPAESQARPGVAGLRVFSAGTLLAGLTDPHITEGNFRLLQRLGTEIERLRQINNLQVITGRVVEAARENLIIGQN